MSDLLSLSAREAAREIAAGRLRAEALMTACLERIAAREPEIGAWQYLDPEAALEAARRCDASAPSGPLHGIPIAVKDLIDTADMPTGYGSAIYARHRPGTDAACVVLARAAGAIVIGKTVTTEFACFTPGKTANPRNPAHTPGGSSSGSAAAVADSMAPLAFGTQTAGSVIRPAAFCGVIGYKPSFGTIPRAGVKMLCDSLDTVGTMARNIADAAFFAGVVAGRPELRDVVPSEAPPRFGFYRTPMWDEAEPETAAALDHARAAQALSRRLDGSLHLRFGALPVWRATDPDPQLGHCAVRWGRFVGDFEHAGDERDVGDRAAVPADGVEREREQLDTFGADRSVGRLEAENAAERSRADHRAAGLRADRNRQHAGGDAGRRAR